MDSPRRSRLAEYRRTRRKFAFSVYFLTIIWLALALAQWTVTSCVDGIKDIFLKKPYICVICFTCALMLVTLFIFYEHVRFIKVLNWLITILIVECVIIGLNCLVARTELNDLLMYFGMITLLIFLFILIGSVITHDLTLDVVILFVFAFIFLIFTVFFIMLHIVAKVEYGFVIYAIFLTIIVLLFVMYHAQTINGGRFAEMRVNDYLLATLILFHDFVIIFMLTFFQMGNNNKSEKTQSHQD